MYNSQLAVVVLLNLPDALNLEELPRRGGRLPDAGSMT